MDYAFFSSVVGVFGAGFLAWAAWVVRQVSKLHSAQSVLQEQQKRTSEILAAITRTVVVHRHTPYPDPPVRAPEHHPDPVPYA